MFDGTSVGGDDVDVTASWGAEPHARGLHEAEKIDRELRGIAKRRAALDAEEARWLREAERIEIWKLLGMVNMLDYMERILGYAPRTARQRMQVARALATLPTLTDALTRGALPFSAVRELVRVATPATEQAWAAHVGHMSLREIEEAVAGRRPGDLPSDVPDDEAREHVITLRVSADAYAMWRQGRLQLDEEHDHRLDDSELVTALFSTPRSDGDGEISGRAKFQIAVVLCPRCERGWQEGAGVRVPVDAATVARARCDAQQVGSLDGDGPERARQDVPPTVARFVWRRDRGRCQTPGCRSSRGVEIHHIEHRENGGSHEPSNLTLRCSACHAAHHRGLLEITGTAPDAIVTAHRPAFAPSELPPAPSESISSATAAPGAAMSSSERSTGRETRAPSRATSPSSSTRVPLSSSPPTSTTSGIEVLEHVTRAALEIPTAAPTTSKTISAAEPVGSYGHAKLRTQARDTLVTAGWKRGVAHRAVDEALAHVGHDASLEAVVRAALRCCPAP